jgi:hypothetical protein
LLPYKLNTTSVSKYLINLTPHQFPIADLGINTAANPRIFSKVKDWSLLGLQIYRCPLSR